MYVYDIDNRKWLGDTSLVPDQLVSTEMKDGLERVVSAPPKSEWFNGRVVTDLVDTGQRESNRFVRRKGQFLVGGPSLLSFATSLTGVPDHHWIVEGVGLREATPSEKATIDSTRVEAAKAAKRTRIDGFMRSLSKSNRANEAVYRSRAAQAHAEVDAATTVSSVDAIDADLSRARGQAIDRNPR